MIYHRVYNWHPIPHPNYASQLIFTKFVKGRIWGRVECSEWTSVCKRLFWGFFCNSHLLGGISLVEPEIVDKTWYELLLIKMLDLEMVNLQLCIKMFFFCLKVKIALEDWSYQVSSSFDIPELFLLIQYFHSRTILSLSKS